MKDYFQIKELNTRGGKNQYKVIYDYTKNIIFFFSF